MRLRDRVAIITGAASGIGRRPTALLFAAEGAGLVLLDIDAEGGAAVAQQAVGGGEALIIQADAADGPAVQAAVGAAIARFGRIDVLVNSAGIESYGRVHETSEEDFDRTMAVNVRSVFLMSKYTLPHMMAAQHGSIINLSSVAGLTGSRTHHAYSASKGAILSLTRSMAVAYGPHGIRVNAICPGPIETPLLDRWVGGHDGAREALAAGIPLRRLGTAEEVAQAALFLAADETSAYVNGAAITVDGGMIA